jgi:hypothetical protein
MTISPQIASEPCGKTDLFVRAVRDAFGKDFAWSWLNRENCLFDASTVYTTGVGFDRLTDKCGGLALKTGVRIVHQCAFNDPGRPPELLPYAQAAFPRRSQPVSVAQAEAKVDDAFQRATSV